MADVQSDTSDTAITRKVKADLLTERGIPGSDISVETSGGVVTLSSRTRLTEAQKQVAVRIAKRINGVSGVTADGLKAD